MKPRSRHNLGQIGRVGILECVLYGAAAGCLSGLLSQIIGSDASPVLDTFASAVPTLAWVGLCAEAGLLPALAAGVAAYLSACMFMIGSGVTLATESVRWGFLPIPLVWVGAAVVCANRRRTGRTGRWQRPP